MAAALLKQTLSNSFIDALRVKYLVGLASKISHHLPLYILVSIPKTGHYFPQIRPGGKTEWFWLLRSVGGCHTSGTGTENCAPVRGVGDSQAKAGEPWARWIMFLSLGNWQGWLDTS